MIGGGYSCIGSGVRVEFIEISDFFFKNEVLFIRFHGVREFKVCLFMTTDNGEVVIILSILSAVPHHQSQFLVLPPIQYKRNLHLPHQLLRNNYVHTTLRIISLPPHHQHNIFSHRLLHQRTLTKQNIPRLHTRLRHTITYKPKPSLIALMYNPHQAQQ